MASIEKQIEDFAFLIDPPFRATVLRVTAQWSFYEHPRTGGHPLLPGAIPAEIRDALLPEDRERSIPRTSVRWLVPASSWISLSCSDAWSTGSGWRCCSVTRTGSPRSFAAQPSA